MADTREDCKYGAECYQKNPAHQEKYKHPQKRTSTNDDENTEVSKKPKLDTENGEEPVIDAAECSKDDEKVENDGKEGVKEEEKKDEKDPNEDISVKVNEMTYVKDKIKALFLVDMPDDFYDFYNFCKSLNKNEPTKALAAVGLTLVGPFDVLDGNIKSCTQDEALRHYRYFYDPPEFQTVLRANDKTGEHYGYYRDDPSEPPCFIGRSESEKNAAIHIIAGNLFGALNYHLDKNKRNADPFKKMHINKIQISLHKKCQSDNFKIEERTPEIKNRSALTVCKTFHGAGIIVPYDKKTEQGYRELTMTEQELKKLLKGLCNADSETERTAFWSKLQPVITNANIACDEYDFGTSLELGINLFCYGSEVLHKVVLQQLETAYTLLKRKQFIDILKAHLGKRTKDLSELNTIK